MNKLTKSQIDKADECICNDYDSKGQSPCGFDCSVHKPKLDKSQEERLVGAIARGWCHSENKNKEMDSDLVNAIVKEVADELARERKRVLEEVRDKVVVFAIKGRDDEPAMRGLCLYNRLLKYLRDKLNYE